MSNATMASVNRSQVHTEVRSPIETVLARVVWFVFGTIEVFLAIRFVLTLLGANAEAGFVKFVYAVSDVFMAPFNAILGTGRVGGDFRVECARRDRRLRADRVGSRRPDRRREPSPHAQTVERVETDEDVQAQ